MPLYTAGHSNHTSERLFEILAPFGITHILDIRRVPYSGRFPHFNRDNLRKLCEDRGLKYEWWGDSLGGSVGTDESPDSISSSDRFHEALRRLSDFYGKNSDNTGCLLCAERDPKQCHRSMLIGPDLRALLSGGLDLQHILADGTLIPQSILEEEGHAPKRDRSGTMSLFGDD